MQGERRSMSPELHQANGDIRRITADSVPVQRSARTAPSQAVPSLAPSGRSRWQRRYTCSIVATDLAAVSIAAGLYAWFGHALAVTVAIAAPVVLALAATALGIARAWDPSVLGQGSLEFTRLLRAVVGAVVV